MTRVLLGKPQGRTSGGHGLLQAVPRIYQVTPDIPDRRRATKQKEVRPSPGRQPQRESARRPVGTISSTSDVTDNPNPNSKPQRDSPIPSGPTTCRASAARPTQQRAGAPSGAPGLLLCREAGVSPCAPGRRSQRERHRGPSRLALGQEKQAPRPALARSGTLSRRMESYAFLASYV